MPSISIRLSDNEYRYIIENTMISGKSMSEYCRNVLLGHEVRDLLPRQEIGKVMCIYHNRVEDAQTLAEAKRFSHEMEKIIWQFIK